MCTSSSMEEISWHRYLAFRDLLIEHESARAL